MHNYPGSWYIPWSIPLQKIKHLQQPSNVTSIAANCTVSDFVPTGISTNSLTCQIVPTHQLHSTHSAAAIQIQSAPSSVLSSGDGISANIRCPIEMYGTVYPMTNSKRITCFNKDSTVQSPSIFNNERHSYHHQSHLMNRKVQDSHFRTLHTQTTPATMLSPFFLSCPTTSLKPCFSPFYKLSTTAATEQEIKFFSNAISLHHKKQKVSLNDNAFPVILHEIKSSKGVYFANDSSISNKKILPSSYKDCSLQLPEKRKAEEPEHIKDLKKAKIETKALKAKRPGFTDDRYNETSYFIENGLRKVYPYYFTFTTFTKGRWVGEKILDIFAREFRAHPAEEYKRCIDAGTLTVNYEKVPVDYRLKHNDLLANIVHRHEVPVTSQLIKIVHMDEDIVVVNKPASIPVHPCGRYRHNTVVFILAKEFNLKNLRTIHRLDRLTSGLLLFGRTPKKARQMEHQIRNRQVLKEYVCRVEGDFPDSLIECKEPIEVVSYKIGVCKVSPTGKECTTTFQKIAHNGRTSVVLCKPLTGRMHQIRVHLQYLGYPVVNDPLYNHEVFGPCKGRGGNIGKTDEELVRDLINIHNAENWLGIDDNSNLSLFNTAVEDGDTDNINLDYSSKCNFASNDESNVSSGNTSPHNDPSIPKIPDFRGSYSHSYNEYNEVNIFDDKVNTSTQTGHEAPDMTFNPNKISIDKYCYECKVRYRDPKPKDLVMYLHAWKYKGPGWEYETELPNWASKDWDDVD